MRIVQQQIEKRMSAMLGTDVTFEKLSFSLLGGSVEALGMTVSGGHPGKPLLTVRRIRAEISLAAALKKELVINALTIEGPIVNVVRDVTGDLNVPKRPASVTSVPSSDTTGDVSAKSDEPSAWRLDAKKVLIVNGQFTFTDAKTGYQASIEPLTAELKEADGGFDFTIMGDCAGRRDQPVEIGPLRLHGKARQMPSLLQWKGARVNATFQAGEIFRGQVDATSLQPVDVKAQLNGTVDLPLVARLMPISPGKVAGFDLNAITGRVDLTASVLFRANESVRITELSIRGADLNLPTV